MSLKSYIEDKNHYRKMFKDAEPFVLPLSQEQANEIAQQIDCDMSPENLHCDGEISYAEARRKFNRITKAFEGLKKHVKEQDLIMPKTWEIE